MIPVDDAFLLQKLKEGDIYALEVIYKKHFSNLSKYLLMLFKNQLLVEHIVEDIFVYIWENRKTIEIKTSLESYLYTASRYKALNKIRNKKRQESIEDNLGKSQEIYQLQLEDKLELQELESIIEKAISLLPERCQQIFRLSREEDMTYKEIADFLNISVNTVESQMTIALKKLRSILRPYYLWIFFSF